MKAYLEIEMPKNCNECPLHFYEGQGICCCRALPAIDDDEILKPWKRKRKDCPLVPAADVRPVVRGKWEYISFMTVKCSNCQETFQELAGDNFCPNCGADMRAEEGE